MRFLKVADGEQRTGILINFKHKIGIGKSLNLYQGQGRKVKGQGQICNYTKILFCLSILNEWLDLDDTYT